jgi:hypothetical protein
MEKYQKFISLIILLAFFAAIGFYLQKAGATLTCYMDDWQINKSFTKGVSKYVFMWATNFMP